ncbi:7222_t:CDS:2 [Dentiscutata erythropus]|uniref:7222_t:CDS:1 n=1 Tax=Dentiscutata erythropus TaxID=1348616 RepID=A0A9N9ED89_9GLOM|nr:7222_t:CDS:2 [Dentiscutata erythropus]
MNFLNLTSKAKTFKPKKNAPEGTKQHQLQKYAEATLGSGNLKLAVVLPEGENLDEWLAVNTYDFFNQVNMLYGTITEFCTPQLCPVMSAGSKYEYHWSDGDKYKKPTKLSAPEYVDHLMEWVQQQLDDESIFPSKIGNIVNIFQILFVIIIDADVASRDPFPPNFQILVKNIFKRLFRVYAHIYLSHIQVIEALEEEAHLNTSFKHYIYFVQEFQLIDKRELQPLAELITSLTSQD